MGSYQAANKEVASNDLLSNKYVHVYYANKDYTISHAKNYLNCYKGYTIDRPDLSRRPSASKYAGAKDPSSLRSALQHRCTALAIEYPESSSIYNPEGKCSTQEGFKFEVLQDIHPRHLSEAGSLITEPNILLRLKAKLNSTARE